MTRDPRLEAIDDAAIEELVRDVVGDWSMPPVRLDAPTWRDRIRSPRARRLGGASGWFRRFGQAATAAVVLTVAGALVAVILTRSPIDPGKSPQPTGDRPTASNDAQATTLPKILVTGDEPSPTVVVVRTEGGDFARVDLATGSIDGGLTGKSSYSELRVERDGSMLCVCVSESGSVGEMPTNNAVTLDRFDARGKLLSSEPIESFSGDPDPRDEGIFLPERPAHVLTEISFSADGRYAFVGWSLRAHPVWHSGVIAVDLASGSIVSRLDLPDSTSGGDDARRVTHAPRIVGVTGSGRLIVARGWHEWSPPASREAFYTFENDVYTADFSNASLADLTAVPTGSDCGQIVNRGGPLLDGGLWLACTRGGAAQTVIRRLGADGAILGDVRVSGGEGIEADPTAVSADGSNLFVWDPAGAILTRVDLATGTKTSATGVAAIAAGPLSALGHWLAPSVAAKSWLRGALVVSPDGRKVYAIGVRAGVDSMELSGSAGVFAFDAATLEPAGTWQPTADFISVAVSVDGRFVYAAGLPSVDATGQRRLAQQASITVYDTSDGSIRLIAGHLGGDALSFISPTLD